MRARRLMQDGASPSKWETKTSVINTPLAAVASAVAHATGHQVRSLPITPEKALLGE